MEGALSSSKYFVEADSFSRYALWHMWHEEQTIPWKEDSRGWWRKLEDGTCLEVWFCYIFDQQICFYNATSAKVNWETIESFLKPYWGTEKNKCNANNFHQCVAYCEKLASGDTYKK